MTLAEAPSGHTFLDFNAPLSDERAGRLIAGLAPLRDCRIVDLGCGWAELLLRAVAAEPTAVAVGVDEDADAISRGSANAEARGLGERVTLHCADVTTWQPAGADVLIVIGASHAWGGTAQALGAARAHLRPGGRLLFGDGFWEREPTPAALAGLGAEPGELPALPELVDLAVAAGYRPLAICTAGIDEWDSFESRWCAGRERWLLAHPDAPNAGEVRAVVDEHRAGWLGGYRGQLGFAYLTLAVPPGGQPGIASV